MSDSLRPHWLQRARPPYLSLSPRVCSNSCPLSRRCHPIILSSVTHFSSCPQSFSASGSFPMNRLFASGGQSIGALAWVLPMNIRLIDNLSSQENPNSLSKLVNIHFVYVSWKYPMSKLNLLHLKLILIILVHDRLVEF